MTKKRIEVVNIYSNDKYNYLLKKNQGKFDINAIKEISFFKMDIDSLKELNQNVLEIFYDSIIQEIYQKDYTIPANYNYAVEIGFRPGVTDNLAKTTIEALHLMGIKAKVSTGKIFFKEYFTSRDLGFDSH